MTLFYITILKLKICSIIVEAYKINSFYLKVYNMLISIFIALDQLGRA